MTAPLCGISPATLAELSKLVTDDWLKRGVRIVGVTDADGGESIKVTVGLPTDGRRYLVGIAYDLAGAIANARPVCEVAANG